MLPLLALNLIPALLNLLAWTFYLRHKPATYVTRRIAFIGGLTLSTIASLLLLAFMRSSILNPSTVGHVNEMAGNLWMIGGLSALISEPLSWLGTSTERILLAACGLSLIVLFYVNGLAASI